MRSCFSFLAPILFSAQLCSTLLYMLSQRLFTIYLFLWFASCSAFAQTNVTMVVSTNVWTVMPWYREVDGKVYDPQHSALWKHISGLAEIKEIMPDAVVWQNCEEQKVFDSRGWVRAVNRIYGKKFIIRHYSLQIVTAGPDGFEPDGTEKIGDLLNFKDFQVIYIGTTNYNGETLPVWDCGKEIKSKTVTVISTNYLPQKER
jgi:hypothetical protein